MLKYSEINKAISLLIYNAVVLNCLLLFICIVLLLLFYKFIIILLIK